MVQDKIKGKEKRLQEAGASVREMAMARYGARVLADDEGDGEASEPSSIKKAKKRRCEGGLSKACRHFKRRKSTEWTLQKRLKVERKSDMSWRNADFS